MKPKLVDYSCLLAVFFLPGIFILSSTGAETGGTNPLSRLNISNSTLSVPSSESKLNTFESKDETAQETLITKDLNILEKVNNVTVSDSNINISSQLSKNPRSRRMSKRRRFKQYSQEIKSRPNMQKKMRKSRENIKTQEAQSFLNFDEGLLDPAADSLRIKILNQLGEVDPLLCLPKALCGISSRNERRQALRQKDEEEGILDNKNNNAMGVNIMDENLINNYLEIMKTIVPKRDKVKVKKRRPKVQTDSSDESAEDLSADSSPESDLSQDDMEHLKEKAKMEKWMREDDENLDHYNWWDILPPNKPYYHATDESHGPPDHGGGGGGSYTFSPFRISKGLTSFFGSMLPSVSWGFGKKPDDLFADDPFFHGTKRRRSFDGRSLSDGNQRSFGWLFGKTDELGESSGSVGGSRSKKEGQRNKNKEKNKNGNDRNRRKQLNDGELNMIDDNNTMEKFQLAVEIGKHMPNPEQCDYVFTGCPFSYLEIIDIIESSKKKKDAGGGNQLGLGILGLINNSTPGHAPPTILSPQVTRDRLEINLKIADQDLGTMAVLKNSDNLGNPIVGQSMSTTPTANNEGFEIESSPHRQTTPSALLRTALFPEGQSGEEAESEDDSLEDNPSLPTRRPTPGKRNQGKRRRPSRVPPRKQWGTSSQHGPSSFMKPVLIRLRPSAQPPPPPPPTVLRQQSQFHTQTKYKPLPTTINKINYHFHSTNSNPQVMHSSQSHQTPAEITIHSLPAPPPHTTPTSTSTSTTSQSSFVPDSLSLYRKGNERHKRRRHKKVRKSKRPKQRRRKKEEEEEKKSVSEERIVIRLPEPTTPSNNYINLYPLLNSLYGPLMSLSSQQIPQNQHNNYQPPNQSYSHQPQSHHHHHSSSSPSQTYPSPPPPPPAYFYPQRQPHPPSNNHYHHQIQNPYYPSQLLPPGMFPYILGKK